MFVRIQIAENHLHNPVTCVHILGNVNSNPPNLNSKIGTNSFNAIIFTNRINYVLLKLFIEIYIIHVIIITITFFKVHILKEFIELKTSLKCSNSGKNWIIKIIKYDNCNCERLLFYLLEQSLLLKKVVFKMSRKTVKLFNLKSHFFSHQITFRSCYVVIQRSSFL